jgi:ABC-type Mn2+/Zn2+ transport system permease subunit
MCTMDTDLGGLLLALGTGVAAGLVGCFAVMRRMTLAADALSHVALPGVGLALLLRLQPVLGGVVALILGALLVWGLEQKTRLATETIIGVVFSTALALGALLTTGDELLEALFGGTGQLTALETALGLLVAGGVVAFIWRTRHQLVLALISPEIARTSGINVSRLNLGFLLVFALTIGLGLRYLGVLLVGSLAIIPAATAKRLARRLTGMFTISVLVSVIATTAGTLAAPFLHRQPGPLVVLCASACFIASLFWRRKPGPVQVDGRTDRLRT